MFGRALDVIVNRLGLLALDAWAAGFNGQNNGERVVAAVLDRPTFTYQMMAGVGSKTVCRLDEAFQYWACGWTAMPVSVSTASSNSDKIAFSFRLQAMGACRG